VVAVAPAEAPAGPRSVVAVDRKTIRRSGDRRTAQGVLKVVSAGAIDQRLVPGQAAVASQDNEFSTLPALFYQICLARQIVAINAISCQTDLAVQLVARTGDDVLAQ